MHFLSLSIVHVFFILFQYKIAKSTDNLTVYPKLSMTENIKSYRTKTVSFWLNKSESMNLQVLFNTQNRFYLILIRFFVVVYEYSKMIRNQKHTVRSG